MMNQLYKKNEYIVIPVQNQYVIINTEKTSKDGHTHIRELKVARLLIDLAIEKRLPKNPYFVDNIIRISVDKEYIDKLKEFKEEEYLDHVDLKKMVQHDSYRRGKGGDIKQR